MTKIVISGALGKMGKKVKEACEKNDNVKPIFGIDVKEDLSNTAFPVYSSFEKAVEVPDVIIDFSSPSSLDNLISYAEKNGVGLVLCTTGYSEENLKKIKEASEKIAIFRSANMSLGVNVLISLVKKAAAALYDFDVEIIEKHHNEKVDAPSGTALMLADGIKEIFSDKYNVYGREGKPGKRDKHEIGIHAVRGGNIVGEHDVLFCGTDETITLSHQATDRKVFAAGAVRAAEFLSGKAHGLYDMNDIINGK